MTTLMIQSYRDSGFEGLIPMGIAFARTYSEHGKDKAIAALREVFEKQNVEFVFNCQFNFWFSGHPNNGDYGAEVIGDAYKMPKDRENITKIKTKKGWQFKCGLTTIEEESYSIK